MKWAYLADLFLLVIVPGLMSIVMIGATLTPGNSPIGLAIGWAAVLFWSFIGTWTAWKRYWS